MDRKEEINKEIDSLETRIIVLKREYDDILKKENPVYVGDCCNNISREEFDDLYSETLETISNYYEQV